MKIKDLTIEVFNRVFDPTTNDAQKFESAGIIGNFKSCQVKWNAYNCDTFQLELPLNSVHRDYMRAKNVLLIKEHYFYIDRVEADRSQSNVLKVQGKSLLGLTLKRIIMPTYSTNGMAPERIMFDLLYRYVFQPPDSTHQLPFLSSASISLNSSKIAYQNSYGEVLSELAKLAETYEIVIVESPSDLLTPQSHISFGKGRDLSGEGGVEFAIENDGLKTESVVRDSSNRANVAYVFGEGEGNARKMTTVISDLPNARARGWDVDVIYVDARDLQKTYTNEADKQVTLSESEYEAQLQERGRQKLAEQAEIIQIGGEVNFNNLNFQYEKDYRVGDRVRVSSDYFGVSKSAVLTSMTETWDSTGYYLDPTFDKNRVIKFKK